jgi:DNA-binding CsgD family transcriptional regulator
VNEQLVDRIYESAFIPELWDGVIDELAQISGCRQGLLFTTDGLDVLGHVANPACQDLANRFVSEKWMRRNPQGGRTMVRREPRFVTDHDIFTDDEIAQSEFYNELLKPMNAPWGTGTFVLSPSDDKIIFAFYRTDAEGPVSAEEAGRLTVLRPHLARAALTSARLGLDRDRAALSALEAIGLPAATIARSGKLVAANSLLATLVPHLLADHANRVRFAHAVADDAFVAALARAPDLRGGRGSVTFPARSSGEARRSAIFHLVPIVRSARDIFNRAEWIMFAIPLSLRPDIAPLVLEGLFDLTTAEARVVRGVSQGLSLQKIAREYGVSTWTIRSQLKSAMAKTGTRRQNELTALLGLARLTGDPV